MKQTAFLYILLAFWALSLFGCGKVGIKGPVFLPGLGEQRAYWAKQERPKPLFNNGDIVKYKMLSDKKVVEVLRDKRDIRTPDEKRGIVVQNNYQFMPELNAWYCVVDFYPSSALFHFDFSEFDNYERRYVYEFELDLVRKQGEKSQIPARWRCFDSQIQ